MFIGEGVAPQARSGSALCAIRALPLATAAVFRNWRLVVICGLRHAETEKVLQHLREERARHGRLRGCNLLGRAGGQNPSAAMPALGVHFDDLVRGLDDVEVVLDPHYRVPGVDEAVDDTEQLADVVAVEAGGGLVEDVQCAPRGALGQLATAGGHEGDQSAWSRPGGGRRRLPVRR
jgi:hypothetical protein